MKPIIKTSFVILFVFSFVGFVMVGIIIHENMHKSDYKNITKTSEEMCYLDSNIEGYYKLSYFGQEEEMEKIGKYTEIKAYSVNSVLILIYLITFTISYKYLIMGE